MKITAIILVAILLSSSLIVGNVLALTPAVDLTGQWSGSVEIVDPGNCKYAGKIDGQITQNGNNVQFSYGIVVTGQQPLQPAGCGYIDTSQWPTPAKGTFDGSNIRMTVQDGSLTFDGTYTSSGLSLNLVAESISGSAQLSPVNFTPAPTPTLTPPKTITCYVETDKNDYVLPTGADVTPVKISGQINDGRGESVILKIETSDGKYEQQQQATLTNTGAFQVYLILNKNSLPGIYGVEVSYPGVEQCSASFNVLPYVAKGTPITFAGQIISLTGDVQVKQPDGSWKRVTGNYIVLSGQTIKTGPNSQIQIWNLAYSKIYYKDVNFWLGPNSIFQTGENPKLIQGEILLTELNSTGDCKDACTVIKTVNSKMVDKGTTVVMGYDPNTATTTIYLKEGSLQITSTLTGQVSNYNAPQIVVIDSKGKMTSSMLSQEKWNSISSGFKLANVPPTQPTSGIHYIPYQNSQYGFSIQYPSDWIITEHFEAGTKIVGVSFSPDKNLQLDIGFQNYNPFAGLTDQQGLDGLTKMFKNRCASLSIQSAGFTCTGGKYSTNVIPYRGITAYFVENDWTKKFPDGTLLPWISSWLMIPKGNDLWLVALESSTDDFTKYSDEITYMGNSFNIYGTQQETVTPATDYSNYGLQKGEWISYKYTMSVQTSDTQTQQTVTGAMLQSLAKQIGDVTLNSIDDVKWIKYTVTNVSSTNILFNEETKVRDLDIFQNQRDMKYLTGTAIPINAKIGDSFDLFSSGGGPMPKGTVTKITTIQVKNKDIPVFELSGSTRNVSQDGTTITTLNATAHYDKTTGLMLNGIIDMNVIGAKYVKMHMAINTIDWSIGGTAGVQQTQGTTTAIPVWVKNTAKWWSQGALGDGDFAKGIQYLVQQGIITVPPTQASSNPSQGIPPWVKNTAKWWAEGQVGDSDFVKSIQYLVSSGIIQMP